MSTRMRTDVLLLVAFCGFLFFYGLGAFGLLGADEPRYAQVAHEMLDRHNWITPTLQGKPWLEKPVLYYWQAMAAYALAGVSDRAARLPAAIDAALLIAAVYWFLRRFRPGSEIDGALITAGSAAIVGFARAAATDMPLAAMFSIALLGWYAWYESGSRSGLLLFYAALALATLAKGPVAPFLAAVIVLLFVALTRDWRALRHTLWIPGILLFFAIALPWYVAVQLRNPEFFRVFILEHNLARFSQDVYHHREPIWYYIPVMLLALMPWTLWVILAIARRVRLIWSEGKEALCGQEDSWEIFLMIWLIVPAIFFSLSQSKLPGYILPAVPAGTLLVAEYVRTRAGEPRVGLWLAGLDGAICGFMVFAALAAPGVLREHQVVWGRAMYSSAALGCIVGIGLAVVLSLRAGIRWLRFASMIPIVIAVGALLRLASPVIDATLSARPIVQSIQSLSHESVPVAVYGTSREQEFGLEFYFDRGVRHYEWRQVPQEAHVLVAAHNTQGRYAPLLGSRKASYLTSVPAQKLDVYWIAAAP